MVAPGPPRRRTLSHPPELRNTRPLHETALSATYLLMRNTSSLQAETAYDPFGEPVAEGVARACTTSAGDRTARRIGGAVFWSLALAILAGRIYASDLPVAHTVLAYATQLVSFN